MKNVTLKSGQVISQEFYEKLMSVTGKRARFVIDRIMGNGSCSTEEIKMAGYEHPPRAKRDVVEAGIPIANKTGTDSAGRRMAVYVFGDWEEYKKQNSLAKTKGRNNLSDKLKQKLLSVDGAKDALYGEAFPEELLQVDHRIPFEIGGDPSDMMDVSKFMLLSPSANRAKSWACEHCVNWTVKNIEMCENCYFAHPEKYDHVAGEKERRLDVIFKKSDIEIYDEIMNRADADGISVQEAFLSILKKAL